MDKEIIENWENKKEKIREYFKNTRQEEYDTYEKIVKLLVKEILPEYDYENITVIDDGEYQGTQIFIIPKDMYQPDIEDYLFTHNYYGSCSGCDTLLRISQYDDGLPTEEQVNDYMQLCLNLIQKLKPLVTKED